MDINGIPKMGSVAEGGSGGTQGAQGGGEETFLKLLVTQLSHQDPTSPTDPTQFVSQLAQFTSLEQMVSMRESMEMLLVSQTAATNAEVVGFVGRDVTFANNAFDWGEQPSEALHFDLKQGAVKGVVEIKDANGRILRT